MEGFTITCNNCGSKQIDISVTSYQEHIYGLLITCDECRNKE
jgi:hypothetical protein